MPDFDQTTNQEKGAPIPNPLMPKVAQVPIIVLSLLIALSTLSLVGCTQRREPHNRAETKSPAPDPLAGLSKLHRSIIGHWIEYRTHTHAYISKSAIVLTREDTPGRQETYSYRVYSEDQFLSTLLLKVKQSGDITEETWEAQAIDYGQGVKLFIGRTQFSYVDSHTQPYLRQDDEIIVSTDSASNNMALERELMDIESQSKYNQREVERQLGERYGWTMTIQHDYWVAIDSTAARFFWVRRANPPGIERWIFIH